jgi:hypothetical protein
MASPPPPPTDDELKAAPFQLNSAAGMTSSLSLPAPQEAAVHPTQEPEPEQQRRAVLAPLPLDWTRLNECNDSNAPPTNSVIRYPWDVAEIDIDDTYLTLVGTAGQKITRMGSNLHEHVSPNLTHLVLRSHLIRTMEGIRNLEHLELLELYDNMIDELRELDVVRRGSDEAIVVEEDVGEGEKRINESIELLPRTELRVLDISYNVIRDMGPIALCPNLQELCKCSISRAYFRGMTILLSIHSNTYLLPQLDSFSCRYCTEQNKKHHGNKAFEATSKN